MRRHISSGGAWGVLPELNIRFLVKGVIPANTSIPSPDYRQDDHDSGEKVMFFDSWRVLFRILAVGVLSYTALVILLRISGKRTLAKMNAFDLVATVALGSTLASVITSRSVSLASGVLAMGLLIGLQYIVAWSSVRSRTFSRLVKSEPTLLFYDGRFMDSAMKRERVAEGEIRSAIRTGGIADINDIQAVVLETDGTFTVLKRSVRGGNSSLLDVSKPDETERETETKKSRSEDLS